MSTGVVVRRQSGAAAAADAGSAKEAEHPVARFRPRELYRLMALRHGRRLPSDETGLRFAARMLDTFAMSGDVARQRAANFLNLRCNWMAPSERLHTIELAFRARRYWSAEMLGNDLDVTEAEHEKARLRTFRIAGMTDAAMVARKKAKDAARKQAKRDRERLHPGPKVSKPALRLDAILEILPATPGEWVSVGVICTEIRRRKMIHFASLDERPKLTAAVHDAVKFGLKAGAIAKRFINGPKFKVAQICRRKGA